MRRFGLLLLLSAVAGMLVTCSEKSTGPGNQEIRANLYQIKGCLSGLKLTQAGIADSCFGYQFGDTLSVEFCLTGNCCPDSNRFALTSELKGDTIFVAAMDTAEALCLCICNYRVHADFMNLPLSRYVFVCTRSDDSGKVYYSETVSRNSAVP